MRSCVKRGSLASEIQYRKLRDAVWDEVYSLLGWVVLYDNDLQLIAMAKAKEMNLDDFKVRKHAAIATQHCQIIILFVCIHLFTG